MRAAEWWTSQSGYRDSTAADWEHRKQAWMNVAAALVGLMTMLFLLLPQLQPIAASIFGFISIPFVLLAYILRWPLLLPFKNEIVRLPVWVFAVCLCIVLAWHFVGDWWAVPAALSLLSCVAVFVEWTINEQKREAIAIDWDQNRGNPDHLPDLRQDALFAVLLLFPALAVICFRLQPWLLAESVLSSNHDLPSWLMFVVDQFLHALVFDVLDILKWSGFSAIAFTSPSSEFSAVSAQVMVAAIRLTFSAILIGTLFRLLAIYRTLDTAARQSVSDPSAVAAFGSRGWSFLKSNHWQSLGKGQTQQISDGSLSDTQKSIFLAQLRADDRSAIGAARALTQLKLSGLQQELAALVSEQRSPVLKLEAMKALAAVGDENRLTNSVFLLLESSHLEEKLVANAALRFWGRVLIERGKPRDARHVFLTTVAVSKELLQTEAGTSVAVQEDAAESFEECADARSRTGLIQKALEDLARATNHRRRAVVLGDGFQRHLALWQTIYANAEMFISRGKGDDTQKAIGLLKVLASATQTEPLAPWSAAERKQAAQWTAKASDMIASLEEPDEDLTAVAA